MRPMKGTSDPALPDLRAAAALMERADADVASVKRALCAIVHEGRLAGVLSILNLHAAKERLDPFEGFAKSPND